MQPSLEAAAPRVLTRAAMRVLFLETSLRMGGTETVISRLMERLDRARVRPLVCCLYEPGVLGERLLREGYPVVSGLAKSRWDLAAPFRLFRLLRRERVDVLFMVNQPIAQFWGTWMALLAGVPVRIAAIRSTGKVNRIARRLAINRVTFPWVTRVTALSETHKSYLVNRERIDPRKIEIIANGVDVETFRRAAPSGALRAALGLPAGSPVVGIVAMLRPEKGHEVFLRAAAELRSRRPDVHVLVVGEGTERAKLEDLATELDLAGQVHFLGVRGDVPEILALCDVCVLSSHPVVETLSNAVLEYMAAGKPVVATRVGSVAEQVEDGVSGFLVPAGDPRALGDRIWRLLEDPALAHRMGRAGRERVERLYSIDQMVRQTEALFERLLNGARRIQPCA